jgi:serine protease Do
MIMKFTKRNISSLTLATVLIASLSSCVPIFIPGKQTVSFATTSKDATVFVDNEQVGKGKRLSSKIEKTGSKQIIIKNDGYKDHYKVLLPERRVYAYYPLMLIDAFFIYPLMIDPLVKEKTFTYPKENRLVLKDQYYNKTEKEKYIDFEGVKLNVENKERDINWYDISHSENLDDNIIEAEKDREKEQAKEQAKDEKRSLKNKKKILLDEDSKKIVYENTKLAENIYKTLNKIGYIDTVNQIFLDNNNTLALAGVITKYSTYKISAKGIQGQPTGTGYANYSYAKAKIYITWYIKNSYGEKIDSIEDESYSGEFANSFIDSKGYDPMYGDAAENSLNKLMKTPLFLKYIKIDSNFKINDPILAITKPSNIVTNAEDATNASVIIKRKDKGHGSGFVISNDGYIITNFHVIADEFNNKTAEIKAILSNGDEVSVKVVRYNKMRDIALLKVENNFDKAFFLSSEKTFKKLMDVYAVGTPKSLELGQSVSIGILSNERKRNNNNLLQLNMSINSGNSGGPLFDKMGVLHGIVTSKLVGQSTEGVAFAIPSYLVQDYLNLKIQ